MLIVPCALTTLGAATLAALASAAPFKNLRRVAAADGDLLGIASSWLRYLRNDVYLRLTRPNTSKAASTSQDANRRAVMPEQTSRLWESSTGRRHLRAELALGPYF